MAEGTILGGIGLFLSTYGTAIGAVAAVASTVYTMTQDPMGGGFDMPEQVEATGDTTATPIDKTSMQKNSELGKLQLGEDEMEKSKRKKGKQAFKIALSEDAKKKDEGGEPKTGVQVAKPENVGAQL